MLQRLAPGLVVVDDLFEAFACGVLALRLDCDWGILQVIKQRIHPLLEQRQPMLHARVTAALTDRLIQQIVASRRAERGHVAHSEATDRLGHKLKYGNRNLVERTHVEERALGFRIERTNGFQAVAKKIESDGLIESRREQIEDSAADRILAGLPHGRGAT